MVHLLEEWSRWIGSSLYLVDLVEWGGLFYSPFSHEDDKYSKIIEFTNRLLFVRFLFTY